jgi:cellulose synthase (UDP-forming)
MLKVFANYSVLTVAAVVLAFLIEPDQSLRESSALALFWSWYNLIILIMASFICIEQPRRRKAERFPTNDVAYLTIEDRRYRFVVRDVSISGLALVGSPPAPRGTPVLLEFSGRHLNATIIRSGDSEFALHLTDSLLARSAMIRFVYSGRLHSGIGGISARRVMAAVVERLLR